jgi:glutaredoxin-like protein
MSERRTAMKGLRLSDMRWIQDTLAKLEHDVTFLYFLEETCCRHCQREKDLLTDLATMASKLHLETYNLIIDREIADQHGVDKVPGTVLVGREDYGVRFFGVPSELEFRPFLEDVVMVSTGESGLPDSIRHEVERIDRPSHIEVITTPACPFSGAVIRLVHQLAVHSRWVSGDMVDAAEFPELVEEYSVLGAPTVVVNGAYQFYGALPETEFVEHILKGLGM